MTRREVLRALAAMPISFAGAVSVRAQANRDVAYGGTTLPAGIRSRFINNVNGITYHILEAGFESAARPCVLLIHGFPELAYSWRRVIPPLARAGFHVIAPDLRGYGPSGGTDVTFDDDLAPFTLLNKVRDMRGLVRARAAGCFPIGGTDERSVCRRAIAGIQHRQRSAETQRFGRRQHR